MALVTEGAEGFRLRGGLPATLELKQPCSEDELQTAVMQLTSSFSTVSPQGMSV